MAAAWKAAAVTLDMLAPPAVSASLVVTSSPGEMVEAPVVTVVVSTSTSHTASVDLAAAVELVMLSGPGVLLPVVPVAGVAVAVGLILELLVELVVLALVAVVELVAVSVVELPAQLIAQELVILVLTPVFEKVAVAPVTLMVVITAVTILILGSST